MSLERASRFQRGLKPEGAYRRGESVTQRMVIDMNEAQVRAVAQAREVLAGTQQLQFQPA